MLGLVLYYTDVKDSKRKRGRSRAPEIHVIFWTSERIEEEREGIWAIGKRGHALRRCHSPFLLLSPLPLPVLPLFLFSVFSSSPSSSLLNDIFILTKYDLKIRQFTQKK